MPEAIWAAVIAAVGTIIAAIINFIGKSKSGSKTKVSQKSKGKGDSIQIGVMNINSEDKKK